MTKEEMTKKILISVRVLIVFAIINTILLLIAVGEPASKSSSSATDATSTSTSSEENTEYDVSMFDAISGSDFIELFKA